MTIATGPSASTSRGATRGTTPGPPDEVRRLAELLAGPGRPPLDRFTVIRPLLATMIEVVTTSPALPPSAGIRHAAQRFWWSDDWCDADWSEGGRSGTAGPMPAATTTVLAVGDHAGLQVDVSAPPGSRRWFRAEVLLSDVTRPAGAPAAYRPERPPRATEELGAEVLRLTADEIAGYAELSGDHNPIHLSVAAARAGGLPGPIHPGLFTFARASSIAIDLAGRDPGDLRHAAVRFARPVPVGAEVQVRVSATADPDRVRLDVAGADGRVLRNAELGFRRAPTNA